MSDKHRSGRSESVAVVAVKNEKDAENYVSFVSASGQKYKYPVLKSTIGPDVVDVRSFLKDTGTFLYDPGFMSTAFCTSDITYIDGDAGILMHRGHLLKDLCQKMSYRDLCRLLLMGENAPKDDKFDKMVSEGFNLPPYVQNVMASLPSEAHGMGMILTGISALGAVLGANYDLRSHDFNVQTASRMIGHVAALGAMAFRKKKNLPFVPLSKEKGFTDSFLDLCFGEGKVLPAVRECIDLVFMLHADHEQNASTFAVRMVGSTNANPYAAVAAGIAALWGPAHGGANESVLSMLEAIHSVENIDAFLAQVKDSSSDQKLMGFGHRVYKNFDPRALILKDRVMSLLKTLNIRSNILDIAVSLEDKALKDPYFTSRLLFPNVDFYSGILLEALGYTRDMFTVLFAVARTVGWMSQWVEMLEKGYKITRPRQLYTGKTSVN